MTDEWTESGTLDAGVILAFDGINLDEQDALDMENFSRGLKAPVAEDRGGKAYSHVLPVRHRLLVLSPGDAIKLALGCVLALVAFLITAHLAVTLGAFV